MPYEIELKEGTFEVVEEADAYAQEGPLTTFFVGRNGRALLDPWAKRLASYRTADILRVRWLPPAGEDRAPVPALAPTP